MDRDTAASWIRRYHPARECRVRLVCFPHAGGSASYYFPVSDALRPTVEVLSVQYPGRQDRRMERCIGNIPELVTQIFDALETWLDGPPVALFGHSMGALVAYEVGRLIEAKAGIQPVRLFASGRRAPSCIRTEGVHLLDDNGIVRELQRLSGTDSALMADQEMLRSLLPAIRGDYRAIETYVHRGGWHLSCPVTVLVGDADPMTTLPEANAWQEHTTGACDVRVFPGGHFFLTDQPTRIVNLISDTLLLDV
jgi:Predicted thioesterase involved in non-ribosomal peptide biosynthesis